MAIREMHDDVLTLKMFEISFSENRASNIDAYAEI